MVVLMLVGVYRNAASLDVVSGFPNWAILKLVHMFLPRLPSLFHSSGSRVDRPGP